MVGILSFTGRYRILRLTWFAFFLTFVAWFNFVPFSTTVATELDLTPPQVRNISLLRFAHSKG